MSRDYLPEAVQQIREEYGDGPEIPDEMIANTFRAQPRAMNLAAAELPRWATWRYRRWRARFDRRQRERLTDFVARHFRS